MAQFPSPDAELFSVIVHTLTNFDWRKHQRTFILLFPAATSILKEIIYFGLWRETDYSRLCQETDEPIVTDKDLPFRNIARRKFSVLPIPLRKTVHLWLITSRVKVEAGRREERQVVRNKKEALKKSALGGAS